ncbi:helix-turn-helix transcriptional regulator [Rummeliibacillus sp. NPDC094406]|uniref:helix-turn-helix transcriptional regulator n=1 Tax=Rummeliibacillus sp. NPDC094406 TaxID=3364511 RepID=UPI0037FFDEB7
METEFLTVRSLANLLEMSDQTAYRLSREGVIPGRVKVGKSVRFNKALVMEWLKRGGASNDSKK